VTATIVVESDRGITIEDVQRARDLLRQANVKAEVVLLTHGEISELMKQRCRDIGVAAHAARLVNVEASFPVGRRTAQWKQETRRYGRR
jgi:hypothetical protein